MPEKDFTGHDLDEFDEHDEDECYICLHKQEVQSDCKCGQCCHMLIEVDARDAEREPKIAERCDPIFSAPWNGKRELIGYFMNSKANGYACEFLDRKTNLCTIYQTRPLLCRLFNCDEKREDLIELGIIQR